MKLPQHPTRRGQPLVALGLLMLAWVGARTAVWASSTRFGVEPIAAKAPAPTVPLAGSGQKAEAQEPVQPEAPRLTPSLPQPENALPPPILRYEPKPAPSPSTSQSAAVPPRLAADHLLLLQTGVSAMPLPENTLAADQASNRVPVPYLPTAGVEARRWSGDGWLLWRQGGVGYNLPGAGLPGASLTSGAYGGSQAGLVIRYRLAPDSAARPTLYLRASSGLHDPRGEELAVGFALRPVRKVPVAVMGEARVTRTISGTAIRPAVAVVTELPPAKLPFGLRAEVYGQGGWVGGKDRTPFIDGQARIEKPVVRNGAVEFRLGAGAWGGAQKGASRLDIGPTATLDLPIGPVGSRLSADYRFRVSGNAAPGSGAAITLSAGF
ncbi:MAG: hypothetical protein KA233_10895 [Novosphingobium sp.]|nr:hypothetical protein [Novosphingobium sp.]MBP6556175.1 hypothetical protein [Novosphingobium sp.]